MNDWGTGRYELTAAELLPSARDLVGHAKVRAGEALLDLGCGTGNVALLAAQRGAHVTAIDPSQRLLEVCAHGARERGLPLDARLGSAESLPIDDACLDVVLSHFALIFADDERAAMDEIRRTLRLSGRLVFTAWLAAGPVFGALRVVREAVVAASGKAAAPPRFAWSDPERLRELVGQYFASVQVSHGTALFEPPSAEAFVDGFFAEHPMGIPCASALAAAGTLESVRAKAVAMACDGGEPGAALRLESPYVTVAASGRH